MESIKSVREVDGKSKFFFQINSVVLTVRWSMRNDQTRPEDTPMTSQEFREYDPDALISFYESKMKFVDKVSFLIDHQETA